MSNMSVCQDFGMRELSLEEIEMIAGGWDNSDFAGAVIGGAAAGAAGGAVVGSMAGGVGAVPGAITGGVGGAVTGMVGYTFSQAWGAWV